MTILSIAIAGLLLFQNPTPAIPSPVVPTPTDNYALGPGDQILIRAIDVEEIDNKSATVDRRGNIDLPVVGKLQAAGRTPDQLEADLSQRLSKFLVHPDVSVTVTEVHSQGVDVLGAVTTPGIHQLPGEKTLFDVLSLAGGLRPDAGNTVMITRRMEQGPIPLPNAKPDATGQYFVASVDSRSITSAVNPAENIVIKPNDVISVPRADIIYVIGAVKKPGGFELNSNGTRSALQILALAEGLERTAAGDRAKIMRAVPGSNDRDEIPVDLKKMLKNQIPDMSLRPDDILFIPVNGAKAAGFRTIDILTASATAFIYRIP
jgi:polysaccharide export outer membrane protein